MYGEAIKSGLRAARSKRESAAASAIKTHFIMVFIYPEMLAWQDPVAERDRLKTFLGQTTLSNFLVNSDMYTIFVSGGGSGEVVKASLWESYSVKTFHFLSRMTLPIFLEEWRDDQTYSDGNDDEFKFVHHYDVLGGKVGRCSDFMGITMVASTKVFEFIQISELN